ncbi:hypothetical protein [Streptomyces indiaensis]|uniref:Uncharacterized protein n=1 Tax=Streptomyces indiaensis TaxID=284033 RepID=A0ABN3DNT5_9ACTN|nr:hypothetical protein [Streptomyces indiaensis]MCF1648162.1 hypothetical protein [Streptomyces indiaensis]
MPETDTKAAAPVGYNLVPPPGWDMIPLREGTNEAIKRIVDRSVDELPADIPRDDLSKARMELIKRLKRVARQARETRAMDLHLPVARVDGAALPASFIVSEPITAPTVGLNSGLILSSLRPDASQSEEVTIDGATGFRVDGTAQPDTDRDVEFSSRRVEYLLQIPNSAPRAWLTISFSTVADGRPDSEMADLLVDLFDAVMTTFRWSH